MKEKMTSEAKNEMNLVYEKKTDKNLDEAIDSLKINLKNNEFGVLWELNFKDKLQENDLDFKEDFIVLEVCNPKHAKVVLEKNIHIGYVLPCKMVVRTQNGQTYIGMTNPKSLIDLFYQSDLDDIVELVTDSLRKSIESSI